MSDFAGDQRQVFKLFVYGTLKRGQPNHHYLATPEKGFAKFISTAVTVERYPLMVPAISKNSSRFPYLLDDPGEGERVYGEIFEVDEHVLATCDLFEGHPDKYFRQSIAIELDFSTGDENQFSFEFNDAQCYLLPQGRFSYQYKQQFPLISTYNYWQHRGSTDDETIDDDIFSS